MGSNNMRVRARVDGPRNLKSRADNRGARERAFNGGPASRTTSGEVGATVVTCTAPYLEHRGCLRGS